MGRGGPLDHPELREIEQLLDDRNHAAAQRLLSGLGPSAKLADGIAYLTTRLLRDRGRLDAAGVADRLRELLKKAPAFPEAHALLAEAEGRTVAPSEAPATQSGPSAGSEPLTFGASGGDPFAEDDDVDTTPARSASWPPSAPSRPPPKRLSAPARRPVESTAPPTVPASPQAPRPEAQAHAAAEKEGGSKRRHYAPVSGIDSFVQRPEQKTDKKKPSSPPNLGMPAIPKPAALPTFRENRSAPSYAPPKHDHDFDAVRTKSLLPRNAGRYSQTPAAPEVIESRRPRPSRGARGPAESPRKRSSKPTRQTVPQTPERIRSSGAEATGPLPTLFEIASWIDEGRHRDAIAAINRAGNEAGAEYAVLRARALAAAGYVDQAFDALERLENAPLLEPELRAACARLFVELGDPDRALRQAERAVEADPDRPVVRLTFALAAVRSARRKPDDTLLERAERALSRLQGREGPMPALFQALKACVQARLGDPERAISIAQRALGLDPKSPDALAAIAEASARLNHLHDAKQAWSKLADVSADEAEALVPILVARGVPLGEAIVAHPSADRAPLFTESEIALASGHRTDAVRAVEGAAHEALRRAGSNVSQSSFATLAMLGSAFLTTSPVFSSFAPFDLSLWSVRRVETALDVLYGLEGRPRLKSDDAPLVVLLGCYLGETLRAAHSGRWEGSLADPEGAGIVLRERRFHPFRIVSGRLHQGGQSAIGDAVGSALSTSGGEPWQSRKDNPVAPPSPWSPAPWPRPSQLPQIGRLLPRSPIGRYCQDFGEGPLDRTTTSLIALDGYLALVAPTGAPSDPDAAWTRRVAVLVGAYLGETIRDIVGGEWVYGVDAAEDANAFRLVLKSRVEATPVSHVLERVIGARSSSLVDYAKTLINRAARG